MRACALTASLLLAEAALAAPPEVRAEPGSVVLGTNARVTLHVRAEGRSGKLKALARVGELSAPELLSADEARLVWTPPESRIPQVALLLLWVPGEVEAPELAVVRIPLIGRTELDARTEPGADVRVDVAGKLFGPRRADSRGRIRVLIEVPPGVHTARVLGQSGKKETEVEVPLSVPPSNPLAAAIAPEPVRAQDGGWLWVVHAGKLDIHRLEVSVQGGKPRLARTEIDRALYELVPEPGAERLDVAAGLRGQAEARVQVSAVITQQARPPPPAPRPPEPLRLYPSAHAAAFYAGGLNLGGGGGVGVSYVLPVLAQRVAAEADVGLRTAGLSTQVAGLGALSSRVVASSLALAGRVRILERAPWAVDVRAGAGLVPFQHVVSSAFQPTFLEGGLGVELFAGVQGAYRLGAFELFLELRGANAPIQTPRLRAQLGGIAVSLGGRHVRP